MISLPGCWVCIFDTHPLGAVLWHPLSENLDFAPPPFGLLVIFWSTHLLVDQPKLSGVTISFQMGMLRHENWNGGLWLVHSPKTVVISSMVASNSNKYATYMSMGSTYLMEQLFWRLDQSETSISLFMIQHAIYHTDMQLMHKFRALLWSVRSVLQKQSQLLRLLLLLSYILVWI